ncbi:N-acetylgalactosamine 6-sulfate sulfatase [Blastopirellula marina]|uniref:N-acetylgalactosamine 6-sulfate sulfatase n=1 Tax=Blastopirellula marina TaxID=124 RepID=A0A2S8F371_9BACT|nr:MULTISPECIES: sulfatase [Pirellulaceae]PQO26374.1 N-acetylgalactosamine 6-sulfate sulfatase [Blastopirellula marina]RCS44830.1 N-acetylgalactosamine 6-sulfate sulfatase [Bremerella cremea]
MKYLLPFLALLIPLTAISAEERVASKPNIVLFLVDDMGWMDSTPYGSQYYETPHMQGLALQSMRFTDAYALPLCSPTRASILSGQYSARHGVTSASGHQPAAPQNASPYPENAPANRRLIYANSQNYLDLDLPTLAEVLQQAGYRTGHFGKWHLGLSQEHWPDKHGFDIAFHAQPSPGPPSYFSPYGVHKDGRPSGRYHVGTITDGPDGEYITDRLTDEAIKFVEANKDRPFFLNFWHYGVHGPWGHKEEYTAEFAKKTDPRGLQRNPIMASMLKSVDESLGRLINRLDELGLADNTLFIFYSDNGGNVHSRAYDDSKIANVKEGHPQFEAIQDWRKWAGGEPPTNNAPLREGKGRIYEGGQRVPLMVRWPGRIKPGTTSDAIMGPIDLYPTILDAVGLEKPQNHIIDGESLLPVLKQTGNLKREAYFTWFPHLVPAVSVRQGDYKLIRRFESHPSYPDLHELYNLRKDIGETQNLAKQMPEKVKQLDSLIDQFVKETGARYPKPNPAYTATTKTVDATDGLVARSCKLVKAGGAIQVVGDGRLPFLGTARVKLSGPLKLTLIARSESGGKGRIDWKTNGQDDFPETGQTTIYELPAGESWQEVTVDLPITGQTQVLRLYLPADKSPVQLRSIRFQDAQGGEKAWDFSEVSP